MAKEICAECGKPIHPGEATGKDPDGELCHIDCAAQAFDEMDFDDR